MLASAYPALDRPMILFQNIVEILYGAVLAILRKGTFGFEPDDRGWVSGVLVGVNNARLGMVRTSQSFGQEALCCGRVLLGREEKVDRRTGRVHSTIQVAPPALDPNVGQSLPANCRWSVGAAVALGVPFPGRNAAPTSRR